jgi:hypothetical protein
MFVEDLDHRQFPIAGRAARPAMTGIMRAKVVQENE